MHRILIAFVLIAAPCLTGTSKPLLLQSPSLSRTDIVFSYAGDLWIVGREGGDARQLTTSPGNETDPRFSPDGKLIAFTGEYEGNVDVYVIPAIGGAPKRLTYHPGPDEVTGWTPDGKQILFRSPRNSYSRVDRLFLLPLEGGGIPQELPLPMAEEGAYSPDGSRIAYVPLWRSFRTWKRYRGGRTTPIWIARLADSRIEKIPRENSNDFCPAWVGDKVYFLSDRNGPFTLFVYDTRTRKVTQAMPNTGLDLKSASAGPDAIVYEQFGGIGLYDLKTGTSRAVEIRVAADLPLVRPAFVKAARFLRSPGLSPTGVRALFEARGEILTVPAEKGDIRNITNTPGVMERYPVWSPDGRRIACFSDESGEYELHLWPQSGMGEATKIKLPPSFYDNPVWSPDSRKIAFTEKGFTLWYVDLDKGVPVKVDSETYNTPSRSLDPVWSPDSRWLAYTRTLPNHYRALFAYSIESGKAEQITDGLSDARHAAFDKNGKHLYFSASTDSGPTSGWLDMSSMNRPVSRNVYVVVLRKDLPSPLGPESDEEKGGEASEDGKKPAGAKPGEKAPESARPDGKQEPAPVKIDFENIGQRILALPAPARNYLGLLAGKAGVLLLVEAEPVLMRFVPDGGFTVQKFDMETRKTEKLLDGVQAIELSFNGEKMLYRKGERWFLAPAGKAPKPDEGALKIEGAQVRVEPRQEWRQMYREAWRIERDFFYDPGLHGLDLKTTRTRYEPFLDRLGSRADLNYLFAEMLGELSVGHLYMGGGALPELPRVRGGLLGADYKIENGRYRTARVYNGENWNPQHKAPLTQPGVNVVAGEYLLAVNGRELRASDNLYSYFLETAGKSVVLRVGPDPNGSNARDVTVVPVESESGLRNLAWMEENRRKVEQMSGGRLAYVYLPNTGEGGYNNFNRYYFAQVDKQGVVIDERFNSGGSVADYIIDYMRRPLMSYWATRDGQDFRTPAGAIFGPKAMIIDEYAGSGGDWMPWMFRKANIGPLIGKRTWGGLVGNFALPPLMDGGSLTAPNLAFYNLSGEWEVENHGVAPDIEVEFEPAEWLAGRDPQLEKAVEVVLAALEKDPPPVRRKPPYPNYHKPPAGAGGARR